MLAGEPYLVTHGSKAAEIRARHQAIEDAHARMRGRSRPPNGPRGPLTSQIRSAAAGNSRLPGTMWAPARRAVRRPWWP